MNKKYCILIFSIAFMPININGQSLSKTLIGSWKTKQTDIRTHSETNEIWIFKTDAAGIWQRELILSGNAITCQLKNPFKWSITKNNLIKITMGKTECTCKASEKKFEKGLDEFIQSLKEAYAGEFFEYRVKAESKTIVYFNNLKLERKE
jgi:uncharacterized Fe-S center protein